MEILETIIYPVLEEARQSVATAQGLRADPTAPLFGAPSPLSSLGLVSIVAMIEERIEDEYDAAVTVVSEKAMSRRSSPFATVGALAEFVAELIEEARSEA